MAFSNTGAGDVIRSGSQTRMVPSSRTKTFQPSTVNPTTIPPVGPLAVGLEQPVQRGRVDPVEQGVHLRRGDPFDGRDRFDGRHGRRVAPFVTVPGFDYWRTFAGSRDPSIGHGPAIARRVLGLPLANGKRTVHQR